MIAQGSIEWHKQRLGKITASRVHTILKKPRSGKWSQCAQTYMLELCAERMLQEGNIMPIASAQSLEWGSEYEQEAREYYKNITGLDVDEAPFKVYEKNNNIGASADGLVKLDLFEDSYIKGLEIKCPSNPTNHIKQIMSKTKPEHYAQMQLNMLVWGMDEWDYVSYCPLMENPFYVLNIKADTEYQGELVARCEIFLADLDELVNSYRNKIEGAKLQQTERIEIK